MERTLVISDIHGELNKFNRLLEKVKYDSREDQLILLGDYVDRGPDSKGVLNKTAELRKEGAIVLRGNHEDLMLASANGDEKATEIWLRNGGVETLESYGIFISEKDMTFPQNDAFKQHLSYIESLEYYYETNDYIYVHGGVDPNRPVHETPPSILVWIRDDFHHNYNGKKTVVFGHTRTESLHGKKDHSVYFGDNNIIGIDGGAVFGGQLNCLEIHSGEIYFVN